MKIQNRTLVIAGALLTLLMIGIYIVITQTSGNTNNDADLPANPKGGTVSGENDATSDPSLQRETDQAQQERITEIEGSDVDQGVIMDIEGARYLVLKDRAMALFNSAEKATDKYAKLMNEFREKLPENVNMYMMLVPTSAAFLPKGKEEINNASQKEAFDRIEKKLDKSIHFIDAYGTLDEHHKDYIFFRTDHHWTALGAYFAYAKLMESMGEKPAALSDYYEEGKIDNFLGSLYKITKSETLKQHPDMITYYKPKFEYSFETLTRKGDMMKRRLVDPKYAKPDVGFYAVFMGGDAPMGVIKGENKNGKSIVVIKDSYGNAFIPFLVPHYETVYFLDPRSYEGSITQFVKDKQIGDVLFLNNSTVARHNGVQDLLEKRL